MCAPSSTFFVFLEGGGAVSILLCANRGNLLALATVTNAKPIGPIFPYVTDFLGARSYSPIQPFCSELGARR